MSRSLAARDYRAVFFDAGGTLLRAHPSQEEVTAAVLAEAGAEVDLGRLTEALRRVNAAVFGAHGRNALRWSNEAAIREVWRDYYRSLLGHLGLPWDHTLAARIYERFGNAESWALYDDVLPTVRGLSDRGLALGIVSDWGTALISIIHSIGLSAHVGFAVVSAYANAAKPDREVFQYALARAGVAAEQAVHVGDLYVTDVLGARGAGIEPILVDRDGSLGFVDCVVVRSLTEIAPLIDSARALAARR